MAKAFGPPDIAPRALDVLAEHGPLRSKQVADAIRRDYVSVYRALLRLRKRGVVTSYPDPQGRYRHIWRVP